MRDVVVVVIPAAGALFPVVMDLDTRQENSYHTEGKKHLFSLFLSQVLTFLRTCN